MHEKRLLSTATGIALTLLTLSGCGGTGGASAINLPGTTVAVGDAKVTFTGKAVPFTSGFGAGSPVVVGIGGASISQLTLIPTPNLANTSIAYQSLDPSGVGSYQIWTVRNNVTTKLTHGLDYLYQPSFGPNGKIVFQDRDVSSGNPPELGVCFADGSGQRVITRSAIPHYNPKWSPDGSKIAFDDGVSVYTTKTDGTSETKIVQGVEPAWSPDSKTLLYVASTSEGYARDCIFSIPAVGGSTHTLIFNAGFYDCFQPCWSPDGSEIVFNIQGYLCAVKPQNPNDSVLVAGSQGYDGDPSFSPDGKYLTFLRNNQIFVSDANGQDANQLVFGSDTVRSPAWSYFDGPQTFIGANGTMAQTASGFLMSRLGDSFASLVAFQAKTPSTATITPEPANGGAPPFAFDLHADLVTGLQYTQNYNVPAVTMAPGVSDVLVLLNANTGQVQLLTPYRAQPLTATRRSAPVHRAGTLVFSGAFAAAYDAHGVNLAPNGASEITVDDKTGKVASMR